jgi:hypothetical protein
MTGQRSREAKAAAEPAKRRAASRPLSPYAFGALEFQLQPELGNQAIQRLLRFDGFHAKLAVGSSDDPLEKDADRVSHRVISIPAPRLQKKCACGQVGPSGGECEECRSKRLEETPIVRRQATTNAAGSDAPSIVHQSLGEASRPLDAATLADMEGRFGSDFSGVRIHTDRTAAESAKSVGALAYTVGSDIAFGEGQYAPHLDSGRRLLAHELAHVLQAQKGVVRRQPLDPANQAAWDWYERKQHRDSSFLQTVDRASGDAATLAKGLKDTPAPTSDEDRAAMDAKINTLIRLNAVTMVGAHRKELLDRKHKFEAMLAAPQAGEGGPGAPITEAERRADTVKAIQSAAQSVTTLNALKEKLQGLRADIQAVVRINAGPETIPEEFATLQRDAYPDPPKDLETQVQATNEQMKGVSWGTKKLRLMDLRNYLASFRQTQINAVDVSLAKFYDDFPFLADLSAEKIMTGHDWSKTTRSLVAGGLASLISPILGPFAGPLLSGEDKKVDDETLLNEVSASFDRLLERTDEAIVEVGSGSINPLDLPGAVAAVKGSLPPPLQTELDRMKQEHEVYKFAADMALALGIAVLAGLTGGLAAVGAAGWAAAAGAGAAGLGAIQLAGQAKDLLERQKLGAAATNPQGELLGVSAPGTLEKVMFAVGVILTAVDLAGVAQEIRSARPHFTEEPRITPAEELPKTGEPGAEAPKVGELPKDPENATQFVNEHPETVVDAKPGQRRADVGGGHEVVEVGDIAGIHCEFHSPGGPTIPCPAGWGEPNLKGAAGQIHGADQYRGRQTVLTAKLRLPNGDIEYVAVPNTGAGWRDLQEDVAVQQGFKPIEPSAPGSDLHAEENLQAYITSIEKETNGKVTVLEWAVSRGKGGTSTICTTATCRLISSSWGPQVK